MVGSTMSVHIMKHQKDVINHLQRHNERKVGQKHSNENIDPSRTHENIYYCDDGRTYVDRWKEVMDENYKGRRKPRKDAVALVGLSIQFGGDIRKLDDDTQVEVLNHMANWLSEKYPHYIGVNIHLDETAPGLQFDFVPLTEDGRLSARDITSRIELKKLQEESLAEVQRAFPQHGFRRQFESEKLVKDGASMDIYTSIADKRAELDGIRKAQDRREVRLNDIENRLREGAKNYELKLEKFKEDEADLYTRLKNVKEREEKVKDITEREIKLVEAEQSLSTKLEQVEQLNALIEQSKKEKAEAEEKKQEAAKAVQIQQNNNAVLERKKAQNDAKDKELAGREAKLVEGESALSTRLKNVKEREEKVKDIDEREAKLVEGESALSTTLSNIEEREKKVKAKEIHQNNREKQLDNQRLEIQRLYEQNEAAYQKFFDLLKQSVENRRLQRNLDNLIDKHTPFTKDDAESFVAGLDELQKEFGKDGLTL